MVATEAVAQSATEHIDLVRGEIHKVIVGHEEVVDGVLNALLSGGHVLLEGVPGAWQDHAPSNTRPSSPPRLLPNSVHA